VAGVIKTVLGLLMLLLAVKQWRSRPGAGEEPALPTWMSAIDQLTAAKGLGLGFLLSAVNPKNLLMAAGAGVVIGSAQLARADVVVVVVVFTVIAAASVAVPVIGYLIASGSLGPTLEALRGWLTHNNATVMSVLLLVIGVTLVGKGIGSF
jgi:threonine/homoserine/homoserine lactone efflux protein